jgi:hypothetical protein
MPLSIAAIADGAEKVCVDGLKDVRNTHAMVGRQVREYVLAALIEREDAAFDAVHRASPPLGK